MSKTTYPTVYNGEPVVLAPIIDEYYMACCDCNLVHRIQVDVKRGKVIILGWRDNRKTAALRRHRGVPIKESK